MGSWDACAPCSRHSSCSSRVTTTASYTSPVRTSYISRPSPTPTTRGLHGEAWFVHLAACLYVIIAVSAAELAHNSQALSQPPVLSGSRVLEETGPLGATLKNASAAYIHFHGCEGTAGEVVGACPEDFRLAQGLLR